MRRFLKFAFLKARLGAIINDGAERPLPLPQGVSLDKLRSFVTSVRPKDASVQEMRNYGGGDFKRFVYTAGLVGYDANGRCLELGSNPYFTTWILRTFTKLEVTMANFFWEGINERNREQIVVFRDWKSGVEKEETICFDHFNVEQNAFPYDDDTFDQVLFCEIIEHLMLDPVAVLMEIKRVLKPGGVLVLTTPNVARLENISRMLVGSNIYDPYSGYGPYGRHNREYTRHDIFRLLTYCGFTHDISFTADVHSNDWDRRLNLEKILAGVPNHGLRLQDLGQYIFVRAINSAPGGKMRPSFLYRSSANIESFD